MAMARKVGAGVVGFILLAGVGIAVLFAVSTGRATRNFDMVEGVEVPISPDSAAVARGRYLGEAVLACAECHGKDLGGAWFIDAAPMGRIAASPSPPSIGSYAWV